MKQETYSGQDEEYCTNIKTNNTLRYKCAMVKNHCVTQYLDCSTYNGCVSWNSDKKIAKSTCESIVVDSDNKRCFLEDDKICVKRKKFMF